MTVSYPRILGRHYDLALGRHYDLVSWDAIMTSYPGTPYPGTPL